MMTFDSENELHKIKEICPDAKYVNLITLKEEMQMRSDNL